MKTIISYKTKIKVFSNGERVFLPKVSLSRSDCKLKPSDHWGYNSDIFCQILTKAHNKALNNERYIPLNKLPVGVSVEEGFLSTINIEVEI